MAFSAVGMAGILYYAVRDGIVRRDLVARGGRLRGNDALIAGILGSAFAVGGTVTLFYFLFLSGR